MSPQIKYLAFLRGINVGGNHQVKMAVLKKTMESLGFKNVKTLLNTGNIYFENSKTDLLKLKNLLEKEFNKTFGFEIPTILRNLDDIQDMVKSDPFKGIKVTPETRLYITFLAEKRAKDIKNTYQSLEKDFRILKVTDTEVVSVLVLSENSRSVDSMNILGKKFGKNITTRNWNTVKKMANL